VTVPPPDEASTTVLHFLLQSVVCAFAFDIRSWQIESALVALTASPCSQSTVRICAPNFSRMPAPRDLFCPAATSAIGALPDALASVCVLCWSRSLPPGTIFSFIARPRTRWPKRLLAVWPPHSATYQLSLPKPSNADDQLVPLHGPFRQLRASTSARVDCRWLGACKTTVRPFFQLGR